MKNSFILGGILLVCHLSAQKLPAKDSVVAAVNGSAKSSTYNLTPDTKILDNKKFHFEWMRPSKSVYRDNFTNRLYFQNGFDRTKIITN